MFTPGGERIGFISTDQGVSNRELGADDIMADCAEARVVAMEYSPAVTGRR